MIRVGIIRSASSAVSKSQYNIQEIGLAKELAKLGVIVDVFLISDKSKTYNETLGIEDRVTVYWLKGIKIPGQQGYYKELIPILNQHKYDLIQALDDSQITTVLVSSYCKRKGIKFVLWQGMYENYPETYKRLIQYVFDWTLLRILRKNTRYCIAKTTSAKKYLASKKFHNIKVIPVGLEIDNFQCNEYIDYYSKLEINNKKKILLYVGKVEERRMPLFCMDLYKKLKDEHDEWCLVYVGKGEMLNDTKTYAKKLGLRDVKFIEQIPQNELAPLYEISNLFILPTRYEIFGMVLMEAMYFQSPVITYKAAGPLDVITNGMDGIIVNDFNVDTWFSKIEEYDTSKNILKEMSKNAHDKIKENYMWKDIGLRFYEVYSHIISKQQ